MKGYTILLIADAKDMCDAWKMRMSVRGRTLKSPRSTSISSSCHDDPPALPHQRTPVFDWDDVWSDLNVFIRCSGYRVSLHVILTHLALHSMAGCCYDVATSQTAMECALSSFNLILTQCLTVRPPTSTWVQ